jgi:hypothetical protein
MLSATGLKIGAQLHSAVDFTPRLAIGSHQQAANSPLYLGEFRQ